MADDKDRVWKAFGQLIQRQNYTRQPLFVPKLGTFTFTSDMPGISAPVFLSTDDTDNPSSRPSTSQLPVLNISELSSMAGITVESARTAFDLILMEMKQLTKSGMEMRKRLPGVGEFVIKEGIIVLLYDRPGTSGSADLRLSSEFPGRINGFPPKSPLLLSKSTNRLGLSSVSPRVDFLLHNQAKLLMALQKLDLDGSGSLPFYKLVEAVSVLENPMIQNDVVRALVDMTGAEVEGLIDYRKFIANLSKFRTQRVDTESSVTSPRTDNTSNYDSSSVLPFVRKLWEKKLIIVEFGHKGGMRPRLKATASEILAILKKAGMRVNLHQLHAMLRESHLDPLSVSLLDLIDFSKRMLQDGSELSSISEVVTEGMDSRTVTPTHPDESLVKIRRFFLTYPIDQVIALSTGDDGLIRVDRFLTALTRVGGGRIRAVEAQRSFQRATGGREQISVEEFKAIYQPQATKKEAQSRGFRVLREWLRKDKLTSEQAFDKLLAAAGTSSPVLTREQFLFALVDFRLNSYEAEVMFQELDTKQDSVIDLGEWCNKVYEEYGPYQSLRDVILGHQLSTEDLLIKMNIGNKQRLSTEELATVLQTMDASLSALKAVEIAAAATHRHGYVDVQEFLLSLSQDVPPYEGDWKDHIYKRIQIKIKGDPVHLRKLFEETDTRHIGKLGLADFQDCVYKAEIGLEAMEIERLARVLDRFDTHQIDYNDFLAHLRGPNLPPLDPMKIVAERLLIFLNQNAMTPALLLKRLGGKATYQCFSDFLSAKVHKALSKSTLAQVVSKMDLNQDGFIDLEDLSAVLSNKSRVSLKETKTYPIDQLPLPTARSVLKDIRAAFVQRRVNYADAFRMLDKGNSGMLTAQDWSEGLRHFIELSNPIKDGLFAVLDTKGIGMVDYPSFLKAMKDGEIGSESNRDNWDTEDQILSRIRTWITEQGISIESVFRAFDRDFDGVVSKADLRESLSTLLKVSDTDLPSSKLDRLYKLMDTYKRNSVQLADFKVLFEEAATPDWKTSARQQLGVFLSKEFSNLATGFETLSQYSGKLTFDLFQSWILEKNALAGFNLTQELLQQLFADMDSHRKGYLTVQDWTLALGGFQWQQQHFKELTDAIRTNFSNVRSAYDYFLSSQTTQSNENLTVEQFVTAVQKLIPKRFNPKEIEELWKKTNKTERSELTFEEFNAAFGTLKYISAFSRASKSTNGSWHSSRVMTAPSSLTRASSRFLTVLGEGNPMKQFYSLLQATPTRIEDVFLSVDPTKSGTISTHEFRQVIRQLGLGLTSRDIDRILLHVDAQNNGRINWKELVHKFQDSETEARIKQIAQQRLSRLRTNMFEYLLSPNDAFKQFDEARSGLLSFAQFSAMIKLICEKSGDEEPVFAVVKDLFQLIDTRKDGVIDGKEWANAFKSSSAYLNWEDTQHFEEVCSMVARNRKMLQLAFEALGHDDLVTYAQAKQVLGMALKGYRLSEEQWRSLLKVADRNHCVDYRSLLEIYKDRSLFKTMHPRPTPVKAG